MELEFHQLDLRYESLRVHRQDRERRLLASLAEHGQQVPIVVVAIIEERIDLWSSTATKGFVHYGVLVETRSMRRYGICLKPKRWFWTDLSEQQKEKRHWNKAGCFPSCIAVWNELGWSCPAFDRSKSGCHVDWRLYVNCLKSVQQYVRLGKIGAQAAMKYWCRLRVQTALDFR